ncbi:MAG: OmpA family protein [Bacteroidota bacterium]
MRRILLFLLLTIVFLGQIKAQEQQRPIDEADRLYERYEYAKSLDIYLQLSRKTSELKVVERIAECLRQMNRYEEAEQWYAQVMKYNSFNPLHQYHYAEILLRNKKFDLAKTQYKNYFSKVPDAEMMARKLAGCDSAVLWMARPTSQTLHNDARLNGRLSDWGLSFDQGRLFFTSDRNTGVKGSVDKRTGNGLYTLYTLGPEDKTPIPLSSAKGWGKLFKGQHQGPIAFHQDTAYVTVTTDVAARRIDRDKNVSQRLYTRRLQLITLVKKQGDWKIVNGFPYNDVNKYAVGHAAVTADGRTVYFTSDMEGGIGKTDIWFCEKQADGSWGKPVNCGPVVNTKEEEAFPFVSATGLLYYASKGLPGMGGYDLFSASGSGKSWSKPMNLKYPVNSTSDDFCLVTENGSEIYLSSDRQEGKGSDDIYSFTMSDPPLKLVTKPEPAQKDVALALTLPKKGEAIVLKNIYYDLDKSDIRSDAALELDKLVALLKQYPLMKIELSAHTDSRAADQYNLVLSQSRAEAAVAYLILQGIAPDRLVAKGYGETRLLNHCGNGVSCSEADHQLNRRTEIKVLD